MSTTTYYEIEIAGPDHYDTRVVIGPDAPSGFVPASIVSHADMLRRIAGPGCTYMIGQHWPAAFDLFGCSSPAQTCWLKSGPNPNLILDR